MMKILQNREIFLSGKYCVFLSAVVVLQMGDSPSPFIMTCGTCQLISIVPSWQRELLSFLLQRIEQAAFAAMLAVSLLSFQ